MSTQHTPGPWVIEAGGAKLIQTTCMVITPCMVISADDGLGPIAFATKDNARLIAAAPELLDALADLLDLTELLAANCPDRVDVTEDPSIPAARAAIAKATGA